MSRRVLAPVLVLSVSFAAAAQESVLWPGEVAGRITLTAPAVASGTQGFLDGDVLPVGGRVEAASLLLPSRLGGEADATDAVATTGGPPTGWSASYRLVVVPHGGPHRVTATIAFANGARIRFGLDAPCLPACTLAGGMLTDLGCDPSCADCLPCDPVPIRSGVDLARDVAFVRVAFTHACRGLAIGPTSATLRAMDAGGALLSDLAIANPDTEPATPLLLPVPAGVALALEGRATLGTRAIDLSWSAGPLQPGEEILLAVGPLAGATLPPSHVPSGGDPRECNVPVTGALAGSFSIDDVPPRADTTLLSLAADITAGPSSGALSLVTPPAIPAGGLPSGAAPQVARWEIAGLLPNLLAPATLAEIDGQRYATGAFRFSLDPDADGLPMARGTMSGFSGALALLANDPTFDPAACGLDPADPEIAVIAGLAPLVVPLASAASTSGLETLNTLDHRACALDGGALAVSGERRADGITELPDFVTQVAPARVEGILRVLDAHLRDDGTIIDIGVERALMLDSLALGPTTSLRSLGARDSVFEATRGTSAESVPDMLDVGALAPPDLADLRQRLGAPGIEDPASLQESDLAARGVDPVPDLSIADNRAALDASETYLLHAHPVALAANLPGPVSTRTYALRLRGERLESPLDANGIAVDGFLRLVDVTKPAHRDTRVRATDLAGALPSSFPGPDFPSIAFPLTLLEDVESLPAGTILDTAIAGSDALLDPAISDGSFRHGTAWANDDKDSTTDTEPRPDANPDDNDAALDPSVARDPVLVKPDDDFSTRSRLLDRMTLEPREETVESFGACFGAVRIVLRAAAGRRLEAPSVTGRGFMNTEGLGGALADLRPDLGTDLNEDGVADQYLVLFDGEGEGFRGVTRGLGRGRSAASVVLVLPAGDYVLEPHALVKDSPTAGGIAADLPPLEIRVECGRLGLVVSGDRACPLTQGFWKRQCAGPHPSGEDANLPAYVDLVNDSATFADVMDVAMLCDRLHPQPENDKCEQAEAQLMAMALNLASGRVGPEAVVELGEIGGDGAPDVATAQELLEAVDALLADPARTREDCVLAQALADAFNRRLVTPASAACDGRVEDGDGVPAESEGPPPPVDNSFRLWKTPLGLFMNWNDLPRGQAGSYEVVEHAFDRGVPPAEWVMDGLADVVLAAATGELGETIPLPPGQLLFYKVRGLSPTLGIPGSTRHRGR